MPTYEVISSLFGPCDINFVAQDPDKYNKGTRAYTVNFHARVGEGQPCKINGIAYNFRNLTLKETHHPDRVTLYRDYFSLKRAGTWDDPTSKALEALTDHCKEIWERICLREGEKPYHEAQKEYVQGWINRLNDDIERKRKDISEIILRRESFESDLDKLRQKG